MVKITRNYPLGLLGENMQTVLNWKKGDRFYVDQKGKLTLLQGIISRIWYFFQKKTQIEAAVKKKISEVVATISDPTKSYCTKSFLSEVFFKKMNQITERVFDRAAISKQSIAIFRPEIKALKQKMLAAKKISKDAYQEAQYAYKVESVRFALQLGVEFEPLSAGASGSYIGKNRLGEKLLVFKPADEDPYSDNTPKLKTRFVRSFANMMGLENHAGFKKQQSHLAEAGASVVDKHLDLQLVPKTKIEEFASQKFHGGDATKMKEGSCQMFEKGVVAEKALKMPNFTFGSSRRAWIHQNQGSIEAKVNQTDFEKLAILDFVVGNLDRNYGNWLLKDDKIIAIDHGWSLYCKHPVKDTLSKRNQYMWRELPQAHRPFSEKSLEIIKKLKDAKAQEAMMAELSRTVSDFDESGKKAMMIERINVLADYALQGKKMSTLALVKSKKDFETAAVDGNLDDRHNADSLWQLVYPPSS